MALIKILYPSMNKVINLKKAIKKWRQGKQYKGFHPTAYHEINWGTVRQLEKLSMFDSTKCCASGTCS